MAVYLTSKALLPPIKDQIIYVIDYNAHRIEELTAIEYVMTYPPNIPKSEIPSPTWKALYGAPLDLASMVPSAKS
ncbi:hypothetical protein BLA14095_06300 [Burkholderia lata]|uniref:hypothetical protein n=1 Tax=Burkholderia lata (strain ATCC 17760 / DSM 23089 / LMG 22485 / NCIMB 9086 / R18194 / 383) TaxID=482957 RepID=UPI001453C74C|nr:hypothetical protein [Burkholderia lata]VWC31024.1 hypothetical protein BLA14095_06300 [Burkholderia lata]